MGLFVLAKRNFKKSRCLIYSIIPNKDIMSHLKYCPQIAQTEILSHCKEIIAIKFAEITEIDAPKILQSLSISHSCDRITSSALTKSLAKIILLEHRIICQHRTEHSSPCSSLQTYYYGAINISSLLPE